VTAIFSTRPAAVLPLNLLPELGLGLTLGGEVQVERGVEDLVVAGAEVDVLLAGELGGQGGGQGVLDLRHRLLGTDEEEAVELLLLLDLVEDLGDLFGVVHQLVGAPPLVALLRPAPLLDVVLDVPLDAGILIGTRRGDEKDAGRGVVRRHDDEVLVLVLELGERPDVGGGVDPEEVLAGDGEREGADEVQGPADEDGGAVGGPGVLREPLLGELQVFFEVLQLDGVVRQEPPDLLDPRLEALEGFGLGQVQAHERALGPGGRGELAQIDVVEHEEVSSEGGAGDRRLGSGGGG
jgi:hypothetical protein